MSASAISPTGETVYRKISIVAMERKRKLPARAARVEGVSKKRTSTPPESQNQPSPTPAPAPIVEEPLPRSISAGKPLPTLDAPQPEDLPAKEYQSVSERSVLPISDTSLRDVSSCRSPELTLVLQWSTSRITTSISSEMAQRRHIREILDEANGKE